MLAWSASTRDCGLCVLSCACEEPRPSGLNVHQESFYVINPVGLLHLKRTDRAAPPTPTITTHLPWRTRIHAFVSPTRPTPGPGRHCVAAAAAGAPAPAVLVQPPQHRVHGQVGGVRARETREEPCKVSGSHRTQGWGGVVVDGWGVAAVCLGTIPGYQRGGGDAGYAGRQYLASWISSFGQAGVSSQRVAAMRAAHVRRFIADIDIDIDMDTDIADNVTQEMLKRVAAHPAGTWALQWPALRVAVALLI